jgi:hypothetical protein
MGVLVDPYTKVCVIIIIFSFFTNKDVKKMSLNIAIRHFILPIKAHTQIWNVQITISLILQAQYLQSPLNL